MSASYHVDVGATSLFIPSINTTNGTAANVGAWVDMSNSDTFCNIYIVAAGCSGPLSLAVQTAPGYWDVPLGMSAFSGNIFSGGAPASGTFSDPTSGLSQLPTWFNSGGVLVVNSGLYPTPGGGGGSGTLVGGFPQGTLPFGPDFIQHGMGGTANLLSGNWPVFCSGGIAFAAFQRNYQYARLVLLSGSTVTFLQAGFLAQSHTTGSGGGFAYGPQQANAVNV